MSRMLTIQIVGWNSAAVLEPTLRALQVVPTDEAVIRYFDNGSEDESVALVRRLLPQAEVFELKHNHGFSGAHNIGFSRCETPLVLTLDPDMQISWLALKRLLHVFDDPTVGAVQGKIWRLTERGPRNERVIDSAGIVLTAALNGRERGANEIDCGQYERQQVVTAATGGCGLYRLAALRRVAHREHQGILEIFDTDFFAYKEDVDLGWRLSRAKWNVMYVPIQVGEHRRSFGRRGLFNWGLRPREILRRLRAAQTHYSLRNWVWMIVKNVSLGQELRHEFAIDGRLLVFFVMSLAYWPLFPVWGEILRGLPQMAAKRTVYDSFKL